MRKRKMMVIPCALFLFMSSSVFANGADPTTPPPSTVTGNMVDAGATAEKVQVQPAATLEIIATIPTGFDKTVLINFTAKDKPNVIARLEKGNGYVTSPQRVSAGTYQTEFIHVVGENTTDYDIQAPDQLVIPEGNTVKFQMNLALKAAAQKPEVTVQSQRVASTPQTVSHDISPSTMPVPEPISEAAETPLMASYGGLLGSVYTIIGLSVVVVLALLFLIYKQLRYKHEYYDC